MRKINGRQAAVAGMALMAMVGGGVGIASASGATTAGSVQQEAPAEEVDGVDCENGIVVGSITGEECDGGPAANPQDGADDATEAGEGTEAEGSGG